jgi:hypothetical protein
LIRRESCLSSDTAFKSLSKQQRNASNQAVSGLPIGSFEPFGQPFLSNRPLLVFWNQFPEKISGPIAHLMIFMLQMFRSCHIHGFCGWWCVPQRKAMAAFWDGHPISLALESLSQWPD